MPKTILDPVTQLEFPHSAVGWSYQEDFEDAGPEIGRHFSYVDMFGTVASVFVFRPGPGEIPDGISSSAVYNAVAQFEDDLDRTELTGLYEILSGVKNSVAVISIGSSAVSWRNCSVHLSTEYGNEQSDMYIVGCRNHLVRVRVTYSEDSAVAHQQAIRDLLKEISSLTLREIAQKKPLISRLLGVFRRD